MNRSLSSSLKCARQIFVRSNGSVSPQSTKTKLEVPNGTPFWMRRMSSAYFAFLGTTNSPYCQTHKIFYGRYLSTLHLQRPPRKPEEPDPKRKWRTHAVSLEIGNYLDYYDDDDDSELIHKSSDVSTSTITTEAWQEEESDLAEQIQELQQEEEKKKQKWIENAKPPIRQSIIDDRGRAYGRGGRKTASARVWIQPGFGNFVVNQKDFVDYFDRMTDRESILMPLAATETLGKFDVTATVKGGGLTGQAGAIRHGLARALNHYNPDTYRPPLKRLGYLTRDPRKVERKKIGHLKARKKPQWVKR